ncbi:MAG: thioesterase family protein [Bacteroidota bacterium]
MQIYKKLITVTQDDLDDLQHVNNVRYVQWIQDIAAEHWHQNASQELLDTYFWVVISHHIQYKSSAILRDTIRISTYVVKSEGVTSTRMVEMHHNTTDKLLVKAETEWCLMHKHSKRPTRIPTELTHLFS